jgi:hypothetical protein
MCNDFLKSKMHALFAGPVVEISPKTGEISVAGMKISPPVWPSEKDAATFYLLETVKTTKLRWLC